jgi:hypothetical protein
MKTEATCGGIETALKVTATSITPANGLNIQGYHYGEFYVPASSDILTITWYVSADGQNYYAAYDSTLATAVLQEQGSSTALSASKAYQIPAAVMGAAYLAAVGTWTSSTSETLQVTLKS